jgi:hypothetical protein
MLPTTAVAAIAGAADIGHCAAYGAVAFTANVSVAAGVAADDPHVAQSGVAAAIGRFAANYAQLFRTAPPIDGAVGRAAASTLAGLCAAEHVARRAKQSI